MVARILSIGTAVPPTVLAQGDVRDFFVAQPGVDRLTARGNFDRSTGRPND